jgi:hypothetical protein
VQKNREDLAKLSIYNSTDTTFLKPYLLCLLLKFMKVVELIHTGTGTKPI